MEKLIRLFQNDQGATMVEYALMVAFIAIVCIAAVTLIGGNLNAFFTAAAGMI